MTAPPTSMPPFEYQTPITPWSAGFRPDPKVHTFQPYGTLHTPTTYNPHSHGRYPTPGGTHSDIHNITLESPRYAVRRDGVETVGLGIAGVSFQDRSGDIQPYVEADHGAEEEDEEEDMISDFESEEGQFDEDMSDDDDFVPPGGRKKKVQKTKKRSRPLTLKPRRR